MVRRTAAALAAAVALALAGTVPGAPAAAAPSRAAVGTSTVLTVAEQQVRYGEPVQLTVQVTTTDGVPVNGGQVVVVDRLFTTVASGPPGTLSVVLPRPGSHSLSATWFPDDSAFLPSGSPVLLVGVDKAPSRVRAHVRGPATTERQLTVDVRVRSPYPSLRGRVTLLRAGRPVLSTQLRRKADGEVVLRVPPGDARPGRYVVRYAGSGTVQHGRSPAFTLR